MSPLCRLNFFLVAPYICGKLVHPCLYEAVRSFTLLTIHVAVTDVPWNNLLNTVEYNRMKCIGSIR